MLSLTQSIHRAAQVNGRGYATKMDERKFTWTEFVAIVAGFAGGLKSLGVEPQDRVGILALNSDRYFQALFAVPWAGGVLVPLNTRLAAPEIAFQLNDSGCAVLLIDSAMVAFLPAILERVESRPKIIFLDEDNAYGDAVLLEELIAGATDIADVGRGNDDLAAIYYTGGTTGRAKGVMLSHRNLASNVLQSILALGFRREEIILQAAPLFHVAGALMCHIVPVLGGTSVFVPGFEPVAVLSAIERFKANRLFLAPTMINMLLTQTEFEQYDLASLKCLIYGASPMPEALIRRAIEMLPGVKFLQAYGQTEASPLVTVLPDEYHLLDSPSSSKLRAAGQAIPGVELNIVDDHGQQVRCGTVGEITVRGANVMQGYWQRPEMTAATIRNGWLHTGDGGYLDDDGFLFVVDRLKDMIVSGGENVFSAEVENVISYHPAVAECAVIAVPDEKWGERVHAVVRLRENMQISEEELMAHCRQAIAGFKCPRSVEFQQEPLPLSGAGKVLKNILREPYWKEQRSQVS